MRLQISARRAEGNGQRRLRRSAAGRRPAGLLRLDRRRGRLLQTAGLSERGDLPEDSRHPGTGGYAGGPAAVRKIEISLVLDSRIGPPWNAQFSVTSTAISKHSKQCWK